MFLDFFPIFLISAVEGLTEFFPVSSTAHILVLSHFFKIKLGMEFVVGVQLGAILAVFLSYTKYLKVIFSEIITLKPRLSLSLVIITMPTLIAGFALHKLGYLEIFEEKIMQIMGINLFIGGIIMLIFRKKSGTQSDISQISPMTSIKIGLIQAISLVPGVSRSASVVFGGIFSGLSKSAAMELSFLSGVPIILCATVFELWNSYSSGTSVQSPIVLISSMFVSFFFAFIGIQLLKVLVKCGKDFEFFGIYRIIIGVVLFFIM